MTRLLVVEGNTAEGMEAMLAGGRSLIHHRYATVMEGLDEDVHCEFAFPSELGRNALPEGFAFVDFAGAVWTGSPLHIYEESGAVLGQLAFAEALYASGVPIFGSCWGLQIMTRALGGRIRENPRGREIGVVNDIRLNADGSAHSMFKDKPDGFQCFTVHLDEVEEPAPGAMVLASNEMSAVQAAAIETSGGRFWGVQYHPEFNASDVTGIYRVLKDQLVREGTYDSGDTVIRAIKAINEGPATYDRTELKNWLASLKPQE